MITVQRAYYIGLSLFATAMALYIGNSLSSGLFDMWWWLAVLATWYAQQPMLFAVKDGLAAYRAWRKDKRKRRVDVYQLLPPQGIGREH